MTRRDGSRSDVSVASGLLHHARRSPERVALQVAGECTSYGELAGAVRESAAALAGVAGTGSRRVALLAPASRAFLEAFLGCAEAGLAAMVLQPGWSGDELRQALAAGQPALALAAPRLAGRLREVAGAPVVTLDGATAAGALARAVGSAAGAVTNRRPVTATAPFYVGFTSGSTGRPKGFVRDHRSWLRSFAASAAAGIGPGAGEHVLVPGPLEHSLFLYAAVEGLAAGAVVHLERRFAPTAVLATLERWPVSRVYLVPTMLVAMLRAARARPGRSRLTGVRAVISSGAPWPERLRSPLAELFPNAEPIDFYGASELSFVTVRRPSRGDPPASVGRPLPGVEVALRRDDGSEAPPGAPGRVWVRSDMLFSGYLGGDTARDAGGWVTVGDLARRDAAGHLYLVGRDGTMLNCGGVKIACEEVERVLLEAPGVTDAAVVGLPHDYWGEIPCAVVVTGASGPPRAHLREHCRGRLARAKWPHRWLRAGALPRTASGKVARARLASGVADGTWPVEELR